MSDDVTVSVMAQVANSCQRTIKASHGSRDPLTDMTNKVRDLHLQNCTSAVKQSACGFNNSSMYLSWLVCSPVAARMDWHFE